MITNDGNIFHIDYGFIMSEEPKKFLLLRLAPEIKWNRTIVSPILKDQNMKEKPFNDEGYVKLMGACGEGFIALRSNFFIFNSLTYLQ